MAFPHLFPDGKADYLDFSRPIKITFREWCEHLMRYSDKRFSQDPRFRFFCLNTMQRQDACKQGVIFANVNDFKGMIDYIHKKCIKYNKLYRVYGRATSRSQP